MNLRNCKPIHNSIRFLIAIIVLLFSTSYLFGQTKGTLSGVILDAKTKQRVPFATVFFANSMLGTRASDVGAYTIENIPSGKYDLTISCIGYKLTTLTVQITDKAMVINVAIQPEIKVLQEVVVKSKSATYMRYLRQFKSNFLGQTSNAYRCTIVNIEDVRLVYDEESKTLTASSDQPIVVENRALGYKLFYSISHFKLDYKNHFLTVAGVPRFEKMNAEKRAEQRRWTRERKRAYNGSITHFMRSLKWSCLEQEHFALYLLSPFYPQKVYAYHPKETLNDTVYQISPLREADLFAKKYDEKLFLKIVYLGENQEMNYDHKRGANLLSQTSYLKFTKHALVIADNGYYEDGMSYISGGYLGWSNCIAELLPLEYNPMEEEDNVEQKNISNDSARSPNSLGTLSGIITDVETSKPIGGASIFLANTKIQAQASTDGRYKLDHLPPGKFDLNVDASGYEGEEISVVFEGNDDSASWTLTKKIKKPSTLAPASSRDINIVKNFFNGNTEASVGCEILNFQDLDIGLNRELNILMATSQKPIKIENRTLGYHVTCWLDEFRYDYNKLSYVTQGAFTLEEMTPSNNAEKMRWDNARIAAWNGSFPQFMECIKDKALKKNGYEIFRNENDKWITADEDWIFSNRPDEPVELKVFYSGENAEYAFERKQNSEQISYVTLTKELLKSWPNIYLQHIGVYNMKGYFNFIHTIGDLLPLDYRPLPK